MFFFSKSGVGPGEEPSSIPITEFRTAGHDKRAVPLTPLGAGWGGAPGRLSRVRSAEVGRDRLGRGFRGPRSARAPPPGLSHRVARVPTPGCCAERGRDASGPWGRWQRGVLGRPAAPLGTCSDARRPARPGLHGVHPEEAARAAAAALLLQGEVSGGREAGSGGGRAAAGARPQAAAASRVPEPRVGPAARDLETRLVGPSAPGPQPACAGGRGRSVCGGPVAVTRGPGRTWGKSYGLPQIPSPARKPHFRLACPSQGGLATHTPAANPGMRATPFGVFIYLFLQARGLLMGAAVGLSTLWVC